MINVIEFNNETKYVSDFLMLPTKLYSKSNLMEDKNDVKKILLGEHVLSKYFKVYKFIAYKDNIVSRTIYYN
jgi:hypothetical protein